MTRGPNPPPRRHLLFPVGLSNKKVVAFIAVIALRRHRPDTCARAFFSNGSSNSEYIKSSRRNLPTHLLTSIRCSRIARFLLAQRAKRGKMHQKATKATKGHKMYWMAIKYANIFNSKALTNLPELFFGMQLCIPSGSPELQHLQRLHNTWVTHWSCTKITEKKLTWQKEERATFLL
jgi:hypothetical protein